MTPGAFELVIQLIHVDEVVTGKGVCRARPLSFSPRL